MQKTFKFCLLTLFILLCGRVVAQERVPISFGEALQRAISDNPVMEASKYELQAADKERKATKSLRSPQIDFLSNYTFLSKDIKIDINDMKPEAQKIVGGLFPSLAGNPAVAGLFAADWSAKLQNDNFGFIGVTMKVPIYMGGKINAAYAASKLKVQEVEQKNNQIVSELFNELVERYFGLSLSYEVVKIRREVESGMKHHYHDAVELEKNGIIAKGERLYAQMHLSKAQSETQKAVRDSETINYALCNTLSDSVVYAPSTNLFIGGKLAEVAYYKQLAMENNPRLEQVRIKEKLAKEGVKAARSEFIPHVTAIGGVNAYSHQVTEILPRAAAGINLSFSIFNGLNREFKYSASKLRIKQVEALGRKGSEDIATLVEKLYAELESLSEQFVSEGATLEFATEYLRIKEKAFSEGMASSSDVVDARLNLAKVKIDRLQIAYKYDLALAKMCEACGVNDLFTTNMSSSEKVIY